MGGGAQGDAGGRSRRQPRGVARQGDLGDPVAAVPAALVHLHRPGDRRAAGDRRQRGEHAGLRPGEEILAHPERFGTGTPEGIIASEASNNANVGGSLVTIMAFGIPGDAVTAVMLGALTIHGIQSGPLFISQNPTLAYGMFAAYIVAHPLMVLIMLPLGVRWMLRIVDVPQGGAVPGGAGAVRDRRLRAQQHHGRRLRAAARSA